MAVVEQQRRRSRRLRRTAGAAVAIAVVVLLIVLLSSHSNPKKSASSTTTTTASSTTTTVATAVAPTCPPAGGSATRVTSFTKAPGICISPTATYTATVKTDVGTFVITMPAPKSLLAVNNFVFLSRYRFYDTTTFHRVIPNFVVQGGDPTGTGNGGPGYTFTGNSPPAGCSPHCYALGDVALANGSGVSSDGSQFFVVVGPAGEQLPPNYTKFGAVTSGMPVVQKIAADGNANSAANGVPPKVTHHIVSVTIHEVAGYSGDERGRPWRRNAHHRTARRRSVCTSTARRRCASTRKSDTAR